MLLGEVPMPRPVAGRPRDARGVPVPAITAWEHGQPAFRQASGPRQMLCALERRCSVCAEPLDDVLWHIVDDRAAKLIGYALDRGAEPVTPLVTHEVPGHDACMCYAAVVCPFLAHPGARRTEVNPLQLPGVQPGRPRGTRAALAGFRHSTLRTLTQPPFFEITLTGPTALHRYTDGTELLPLLRRLIAAEPPSPARRPDDDFGPDDEVVSRRLTRALRITR